MAPAEKLLETLEAAAEKILEVVKQVRKNPHLVHALPELLAS